MASKTKKGLLVLTAVLILLPVVGTGCSPKIIERVVYQRDTTVVHHRDTTFRRDSVYIREWMKGDTVYIEKYKDRFVYRDRWRDSIRVVRDSAVVEHIKEVKVEKPLSWSQKAKIGAFPWILLALIGAVLWIFRKYLF